jgi:PadR family transcriptional regulator, regulatory protein AphA
MTLDFAILGFLDTGPGSGYDLVQQMDLGIGWFWAAAHSQIYPRLKELEAQGLITSESVTVGTKLEKRVYQITEAGRVQVREWAAEPPSYPPNRDSERLKLIFSDHGDVRALRLHLETHLEHYRRRRESLKSFVEILTSRKHQRIERRIEAAQTEAEKELVLALREMAYRGNMRRADQEIAWATECLEWLDAFERRHGLLEHSTRQ